MHALLASLKMYRFQILLLRTTSFLAYYSAWCVPCTLRFFRNFQKLTDQNTTKFVNFPYHYDFQL